MFQEQVAQKAARDHHVSTTPEELTLTPKVTEEDIVALGNAGRWHGQELSVEPREDGWLIKVFSCYS